MADDNILQTEIDLDAIEAETERRVEKHRLLEAMSTVDKSDDKSDASEEAPIPKGSVIKLNTADAELEQLSTYWDDPPDEFKTRSKPHNDWQWQQWDSDEPDDPVDLTDEWNGDINDVYDVDDDDTYANINGNNTAWDNKNHCWTTKKDTKLAAARWWDNQTDETEIMCEVLQKIEEVGVQVDHLSSELAGIEHVVDEVSSTTNHISNTTSKLTKDMAILKREMMQIKSNVQNTNEYLKILITHFIEEESDSSTK